MKRLAVALLLLLTATARTHAQWASRATSRELTAELLTGTAWKLPLPGHVELPGGRARFRAHFS